MNARVPDEERTPAPRRCRDVGALRAQGAAALGKPFFDISSLIQSQFQQAIK